MIKTRLKLLSSKYRLANKTTALVLPDPRGPINAASVCNLKSPSLTSGTGKLLYLSPSFFIELGILDMVKKQNQFYLKMNFYSSSFISTSLDSSISDFRFFFAASTELELEPATARGLRTSVC